MAEELFNFDLNVRKHFCSARIKELRFVYSDTRVYATMIPQDLWTMELDEFVLSMDFHGHNLRIDESTIEGAGRGLFALTDIPANTPIVDYWGKIAFDRADKNMENMDAEDVFNGYEHRAVKTRFSPFRHTNGKIMYMYVVGSRSCAGTYVNTLTPNSVVRDLRQHEAFTGIYGQNYNIMDCFNCYFKETKKEITNSTLFLQWLKESPVQIYSSRNINAGEELFAEYPLILDQNPLPVPPVAAPVPVPAPVVQPAVEIINLVSDDELPA